MLVDHSHSDSIALRKEITTFKIEIAYLSLLLCQHEQELAVLEAPQNLRSVYWLELPCP